MDDSLIPSFTRPISHLFTNCIFFFYTIPFPTPTHFIVSFIQGLTGSGFWLFRAFAFIRDETAGWG